MKIFLLNYCHKHITDYKSTLNSTIEILTKINKEMNLIIIKILSLYYHYKNLGDTLIVRHFNSNMLMIPYLSSQIFNPESANLTYECPEDNECLSFHLCVLFELLFFSLEPALVYQISQVTAELSFLFCVS